MPYKLPKIPHPPLMPRNKYEKPQQPPWTIPPTNWTGSVAEWAVAWALQQKKIKYIYQFNIDGGKLQAGGIVIDFYIPDRMLMIRVQGLHWHYELGGEVVAIDIIVKGQLEGMGYVVVDIDEDHALKNPKYYVEEALNYRDHSRGVTGV